VLLRTNSLERGTPCQKRQLDTMQSGKSCVIDKSVMSHTAFRLVPKSVTLNDLERRNNRRSRYLCSSWASCLATLSKVCGLPSAHSNYP